MNAKTPIWLRQKAITYQDLQSSGNISPVRKNNTSFIHQVWKTCVESFKTLTGRFNLRKCSKVGKSPRACRKLYVNNKGRIVIGDNVTIKSDIRRIDLITGPEGYLEIGNEVSINAGTSIVANESVRIGNRVKIGPYTMICDTNLHENGRRYGHSADSPIVIEDDAWLETRVMVLKGSRIGKGSIITSGSVVSGIVPPYVVVGGCPAKIIKHLDPPRESGFHWEHNYQGPDIKNTTSSRVRKVAADIFSKDIDSIKDGHSHTSYSNWNSLQHVKFIHALEQEFAIRLGKEDWIKMSSIGRITSVIQKYLDEKAEGQYKSQIGIGYDV